MALSFTYPHGLGCSEARQRLVAEAARQDVQVSFSSEDPMRGEVEASSPLGAVRARFAIREADLAVEVTQKPALVPASLVRGAIEDGLAKLLG